MHRCSASDADLLLDTWGWRFLDLFEAETIHRTLVGYTLKAGQLGVGQVR